MEAVKAESVALVREILQRGGDPNAVDRNKINAAHLAASKGLFEVREEFLLTFDISPLIISGDVGCYCVTVINAGCIATITGSEDVVGVLDQLPPGDDAWRHAAARGCSRRPRGVLQVPHSERCVTRCSNLIIEI